MTSYMNDLMGSYNTTFPLKKIQKKPPNYLPWISQRLKLCIRKKSKLYKLYVSDRVSRLAYTSFRNRLTAVLRRAKGLYYVELFYNCYAPKEILTSPVSLTFGCDPPDEVAEAPVLHLPSPG